MTNYHALQRLVERSRSAAATDAAPERRVRILLTINGFGDEFAIVTASEKFARRWAGLCTNIAPGCSLTIRDGCVIEATIVPHPNLKLSDGAR